MGLGSSHITTTTAANFIPEVWMKETRRTREANLVFAKKVKRIDKEVMNYGDTIHIPHSTNTAAAAKSANTEVTYSVTTEDKTDVSINRHYYVAQMLEDIVKKQSIVDAEKEIRWNIGYGLAKELDAYIGSLAQSATWTYDAAGSESGDPGKSDIIYCVQKLDDADAPAEDRSGVVKPRVWAALLNIDEFSKANSIAFSQANSPLLTWKMAPVYGIDWAKSTNVYSTGSIAYNAVFHKDAIALAIQSQPFIEKQREAGYIGDSFVGSHLYGAAQLRADHLIVLKSAS